MLRCRFLPCFASYSVTRNRAVNIPATITSGYGQSAVLLSCSFPKIVSATFVKSVRFGTLNSTPVHAVCSVYDLRPISQAGRRGFDPRLPLLIFKSFQPSKFGCRPNAALFVAS